MFGLIYKTVNYFFAGTALNKGEKDQPPPLDDQIRDLKESLKRLHRERAILAERLRLQQDANRGDRESADQAKEEQ